MSILPPKYWTNDPENLVIEQLLGKNPKKPPFFDSRGVKNTVLTSPAHTLFRKCRETGRKAPKTEKKAPNGPVLPRTTQLCKFVHRIVLAKMSLFDPFFKKGVSQNPLSIRRYHI